ncbi:hypothetical protein AJ78_08105 [Emergomyces pasteurianus Ep9510]|uniref:PQ loop repeat protein n=1 Tax=Emergomyces pasteurianus Ep9510 TaxID=1447872 RepID=A0A1J9Q459_9EURO|nr:hypothetical protein AJ78_08105 [Emergomyces pasteurianus Ep9510]
MPRDEKIPVAANVLGTIGTVLWCIQLAPQIWHNWRLKKTDGLPASMMFLWALCAVPFGVYMILQQVNIPIQIQPQMFGSLCTICWAQILYYNHGYSLRKAISAGVLAAAFFGGCEALFILTLRIPYSKGITWPGLLFGIIATVLVAIGLIPPYFELWKRQGRVIGISWFFLSMDTLGAIFSLLALVVEGTFDILGGIVYIVVLLLELGIFTSHIIWRFRFRELRKAAKASGMSIDDFLELKNRGASCSSSSSSKAGGAGGGQNGGDQQPTAIAANKTPNEIITVRGLGSSEAVPRLNTDVNTQAGIAFIAAGVDIETDSR